MREVQVAKLESVHGTQQSPINITAREAFSVADQISGTGYDQNSFKGHVVENAEHHYFELSERNNKKLPSVEFRSTRAVLKSIHFHAPSEHQLEGNEYDAEFHFVHDIVSKEVTGNAHVQEPSTKLVIGVFANAVKSAEEIASFCNSLKVLKETGKPCPKECEFPAKILNDIPSKFGSFFHYRGSLTSGEHLEIVSWIVLKEAIGVSSDLLEEIESLDQPTRELQLLNRRILLVSGT